MKHPGDPEWVIKGPELSDPTWVELRTDRRTPILQEREMMPALKALDAQVRKHGCSLLKFYDQRTLEWVFRVYGERKTMDGFALPSAQPVCDSIQAEHYRRGVDRYVDSIRPPLPSVVLP